MMAPAVHGMAWKGLALATAVAVDLLWGEPPSRLHPVVWMGSVVGALARRAPAGPAAARLGYGGGMVALSVTIFALPAGLLERQLRRLGWPGAVALGLCLKPTFAIRALLSATQRVRQALDRKDLPAAREALRSLVSRDATALPAALLAAAAIESVAENSSDSVVAPLFFYALGGLAGATAYRVINTLDAMVGYHGETYEHLGKLPARVDDLVNLVPARMTGLLFVTVAPLAGGSSAASWRVMRRDHHVTASPNAGWPMSAAAGALDVSLEKVGYYRLNAAARLPEGADVGRAMTLTKGALALGGALAALCALARGFVLRRTRIRWGRRCL